MDIRIFINQYLKNDDDRLDKKQNCNRQVFVWNVFKDKYKINILFVINDYDLIIVIVF